MEHNCNRRHFIKLATGLTALGYSGLWSSLSSASTADYKALICIYLAGGNDGNNMIIPMDTKRYIAYKSLRSGLALTGTELATPILDKAGNSYAFNAGLSKLNPLYLDGHLAVVLNTGTLVQPLTRSQYLSKKAIPSNLYSHSDQTTQAQTGHAVPNGLGWGGRVLDVLGERGNLAAVSVTYPALFLEGDFVSGNTFGAGSTLNLAGMNINPKEAASARRQALENVLSLDADNPIRSAANQVFANGLKLSDTLKGLDSALPGLTTAFPNTSIGNQLKEVLRQIRLRSQLGPGRQVFFCSLGGFDTHEAQKWQQNYLFTQLAEAMTSFYAGTIEIGLQNQVTCFTQSEFGRTLQASGSGSDHAWGSHQLVMGGAVRGNIYGKLPEFTLGGPDDANNRGVWIPQIATCQFAATLGQWFGATETDIALILPGLDKFSSNNIGFML